MANSTYSGDPSTSPKDEVRFLLSDTDMSDPIFTDQEIMFLLEENGGPYMAAAEGAMIQSGKYSQMSDMSVGPLSISYGEVADRWSELASNLQRRASKTGVEPILTGNSKYFPPVFSIGMNDYYRPRDPTPGAYGGYRRSGRIG